MGPADMLHAAGSTWASLEGTRQAQSGFAVDIVGRSGQAVSCFKGTRLLPGVALEDLDYQPDVVLVPALFEESVRFGRSGWSTPWRPFVHWIARRHQRGALIAAISTGSALLAETGLLDGKKATTHWALHDAMAANYQKVEFVRNQQVQIAAPHSRLLTSGAGTAWQSLVLLLVARFRGAEQAMELARLFAASWPEQDTRRYSGFLPVVDHGDAQVLKAQRYIADRFPDAQCIAAAAESSGMMRRTFERRFRAATGYSPLAYLQEVRMQRARELLESSTRSVEDIAVSVGYHDLPHFRALFLRMCVATPSQYRESHGCSSLLHMTAALA